MDDDENYYHQTHKKRRIFLEENVADYVHDMMAIVLCSFLPPHQFYLVLRGSPKIHIMLYMVCMVVP